MKLALNRFLSLSASSALLVVTLTGCKQLPGSPGTQGAAIGGLGGAAAGAAVGGEKHRVLGALLGGALGAGAGYVVGANSDRITGKDRAGAEEAARRAQTNPATTQQAVTASTADLNGDGFVTMDEVLAMKKAGLSDQQMVDRLRATGQVFELTQEQQNYLRQNGVSETVIAQMPDVNRQVRDRLSTTAPPPAGVNSVISQPASSITNSAPPTSTY